MPISDNALQKEKNGFIAVTGDAKFGQVIAALNAVGGQPWWHVVVQLPDGSWRAARISETRRTTRHEQERRRGTASGFGGNKTVASVDRYTS
jgi:hypothetical protein